MLRYLKEKDAADRLENAIAAVIAEGKDVTYDMKPDRNDPTAVGTSADGRRHHREAITPWYAFLLGNPKGERGF